MATVETVRPLIQHAEAGHKTTGSGKIILQDVQSGCVPMDALGKLIVESIDWSKSAVRQNPDNGRVYATTGQQAVVVDMNGKQYTVSLSVTEKAAKSDEFALSAEESANPAFATILSMRATIGDVPTKKALRALRGQK